MGSNCQLWIIFFNRRKNRYVDIPKTFEAFKKDTELLNKKIKVYPEIP